MGLEEEKPLVYHKGNLTLSSQVLGVHSENLETGEVVIPFDQSKTRFEDLVVFRSSVSLVGIEG